MADLRIARALVARAEAWADSLPWGDSRAADVNGLCTIIGVDTWVLQRPNTSEADRQHASVRLELACRELAERLPDGA